MTPFDYVNDINHNKSNIIKNSDNPELAEKLYPPFFVNRALSQYVDTVRISNEMNIHHQLDKKLQFDFLINIVRKKKRFTKWAKKEDDDNLEVVVRYYKYSYDKASAVLPLLSETQLKELRRRLYTGGTE